MASALIIFLLLTALLSLAFAIQWNGDWAFACDFKDSDLASISGYSADKCSGFCASKAGCTHYTWTSYQGGTCWMKKGPASKQDAVATSDSSKVCGILPVQWQGDWAYGCDFHDSDLASAAVPASQCGPTCQAKAGCTHYTWTMYQGGTCWMKQGPVSKQDAWVTGDGSMVCGVVSSTSTGGGGGSSGGGGGGSGAPTGSTSRDITITNMCKYPVWMGIATNGGQTAMPDGNVKLSPGQSHKYSVPAAGWAGRFWPKTGCDSAGNNCAFGTSSSLCPSSGCQPPADTKAEFFLPALGSTDSTFYDISLVDGYTLPLKIAPRGVSAGRCAATSCNVSLGACPSNEVSGIGDLRVVNSGKTVACLSPCKKWNYPAPYGLGKPETVSPGVDVCCPTPPISPSQCAAGPVISTQFVRLIKKNCPSAYSFTYDDNAALHSCPQNTSFDVTICP